jgi:hypothetical protein
MNFARALDDIAEHGATDNRTRAALARDTIYMPSELAARLLSRDAYRDHEPHFRDGERAVRDHGPQLNERLVWDATALGGGRRSPAR